MKISLSCDTAGADSKTLFVAAAVALPLLVNVQVTEGAFSGSPPLRGFDNGRRAPWKSGDRLAKRFSMLKRKWREKAAHLSSPKARALADEYQQIIGLGFGAVPLLLDDLRRHQGWWFRALRAITGEDPVPASERGDYRAMAKRWIAWGEERRLC